jgi:glutamyl-tRNA reductase
VKAGVGDVVVANRTAERAERLADVLGGKAVGLEDVPAEIGKADIVVSTTSAVGYVATYAVVAAALSGRAGRPLALVDLALPRDVDPAVRELPGVTLVDLDGLRTALEGEPAGADVAAVRGIVDEEVEGFAAWRHARRVAPTVTALREKADGVVADEMQRLIGRLPELDDVARAEVEQAVRRAVDKILHAPTVRVKELAATDGGDRYAEALRELFDLDPGTLSAVSEPVPAGRETP